MLSALLNALTQAPEDRFISQVDKELQIFCRNFEDNLRETMGSNTMAIAAPIAIPVDFKIDDWNKAAEKSFQTLMRENPEGLDEVMKAVFNIKLKFDDEDDIPADLLNIDIDMHGQDGHPIDYFDGFEGGRGYKAFAQNCAQSGLDFRLYLEPKGDGEHANITIALWSQDQRPILSCVREASNNNPTQEL